MIILIRLEQNYYPKNYGEVSLTQVLNSSSLMISNNSEKEKLELLRVLDDANFPMKNQREDLSGEGQI